MINPRPLLKVLNHRQELFSIQSLSTNVIYIEIGCNKVNTKNENIFNFIDDWTVSSMFRTAKPRLFPNKYTPYFILGR